MNKIKIAVGSDHAGFELKSKVISYLKKKGYSVKDFGTYSQQSCDYPFFAYKVAKAVALKRYLVANKVKGIRAALCYNILAARLSRLHNDANILVLGAEFVNIKVAKKIIDIWLNTDFEGGRHLRRIKQIERIEKYV